MSNRTYNFATNAYFHFQWFLFVIISLSACSEYLPPASNLVSGRVTLSWNEVSDAISYNVYGSTSPGVTKFNGSKFRNTPNPFTITQLQPGKTYYFVVTVITDSGESKESKELSYTAVMDKVGFIDFKNLTDQPIKNQKYNTSEKGNVTLAWDNVPNATSYNVYWKDSPGVTMLNGNKISNVKNPHTIKGLKPGTYFFVITAVNEMGESAESEELAISIE